MITTMTPLKTDVLQKAANEARGLAMDAVTACKSGHLGLPLGAAEIGAVLFGKVLNIDPEQPKWINRDRFVLSAGHGSMFAYAWLHLSGFPLSLEEVKNFRKMGSKTPGHPESFITKGVECTSGPLGQGVGNSVGMAMAAKMAEARYNTKDHTIFDHNIICLAGDGCLQEGVAAEASSLAGHLGLDNLILIYDSNDVTLDAAANKSQSEDTAARYKAYGFEVVTINGHDMEECLAALEEAKSQKNGKPKFIVAKTEIGRGIPEVAGTNKAHGEAGVKFVDEARKALGLPAEKFYVSEEVRAYFAEHKKKQQGKHVEWKKKYDAWKAANPQLASELEGALNREVQKDLLKKIPEFTANEALATRVAGEKVLNAIAAQMLNVVSGSADLHGSTKNYIKDGGDFSRDNRSGRNIYFGIREHAMGSIVNGFGYYGIYRPSGATFLVFSDYMRPTLRLAAMSELPIFHIFTHDSVGVGEDGPTHQPVEHVSSLRLIPELDVIRPGDPEETAGAFYAALERKDGPSVVILSRQNLPNLSDYPVNERREGVLRGGYILKKEEKTLETILIATGSELQHAVEAAKKLGSGTRVVSMPCCERFDRQDEAYKNKVLPKDCQKRISIEAGVTAYWHKYVGKEGITLGIDQFGTSAPGGQVMEKYGMTAQAVVDAANKL